MAPAERLATCAASVMRGGQHVGQGHHAVHQAQVFERLRAVALAQHNQLHGALVAQGLRQQVRHTAYRVAVRPLA